MCLLTYLPAGAQPDPDALTRGASVYDDGHGYALVAGERLVVRRGMDAAALIAAFVADRAAHPDGPALFHSRYRTSGAIGPDNCHPFALDETGMTVLAHNGILPADAWPGDRDPRCDTRVLVEDRLHRFGPLHRAKNRNHLRRWLSPGNKVLLLTVDPRYRQHAHLINEHAGIWDGGIWYSNHAYQHNPRRPAGTAWNDAHYDDVNDWDAASGDVHPAGGLPSLTDPAGDHDRWDTGPNFAPDTPWWRDGSWDEDSWEDVWGEDVWGGTPAGLDAVCPDCHPAEQGACPRCLVCGGCLLNPGAWGCDCPTRHPHTPADTPETARQRRPRHPRHQRRGGAVDPLP